MKTLVKDGVLHLAIESLKTKCGLSIAGMSPFDGWKSACEKCYGPDADLETVAKKIGVTINQGKVSRE